MARVLMMPLPARDFDPSEAAVSWRVLVDTATPSISRRRIAAPAADIMLTRQGPDPGGAISYCGKFLWSGL